VEQSDTVPSVTGPIPLAEALTVWGDPSAVAEMARLHQQGYSGPQILVLNSEKDQGVWRYRDVRK